MSGWVVEYRRPTPDPNRPDPNPPPHPTLPDPVPSHPTRLALRLGYESHLFQPRFWDLLRAALAHAAVLHHALPVLFPERALLLEVHLVVLEENS